MAPLRPASFSASEVAERPTDNGAPTLNDTAVITINLTNVHEAPVVNDQTFTVAENTGNGTAVGTWINERSSTTLSVDADSGGVYRTAARRRPSCSDTTRLPTPSR